jgi:hypothetical protein
VARGVIIKHLQRAIAVWSHGVQHQPQADDAAMELLHCAFQH